MISALLLGWTGLGNLGRPDGARHPSGEADHAGQHHYAQEDQVDDSWDGFPMELVWVAGERDGLQHGKQELAKDVDGDSRHGDDAGALLVLLAG